MDSSEIKRGIRPATSSDDSDHILSDIRTTRNRMDHTIDELGDKLQPRHLMEDAVDYFWTKEQHLADKSKESAAKMGRKVVDEVREHPLPSLLIGAGLVWLLAQQKHRATMREEGGGGEEPGFKEKAGEKLGAVKERLQEGGASAREHAAHMVEGAKEKLGSAKERLSSAVGSARLKSSELKEKTKDYYHRTSDRVRQTSDEHPLALGFACLAAGVVAGVMAPRTRMEDQTFGAVSDRVRERGKREAEEIAQKSKNVAERAVETAREEARSQDLTPEGLTGQSEERKPAGYVQPEPGL